MAKEKSVFFCKECGQESPRWQGQCPGCGQWNTLVEERIAKGAGAPSVRGKAKGAAKAAPLAGISLVEQERVDSGSAEFNRVLGGGFLLGSFLLLSGDPGIGKSTLVLQIAAFLAEKRKVLYVSGEESARQIRLRAERLGIASSPVHVFTETSLNRISEEILAGGYEAVFIDSIQTVYLEELESAPGSVGQVREGSSFLLKLAKEQEIMIFLIGHVTKDGAVAGPRILEHMVDTVLTFEGDRHHLYRLLRAVKNRFGPANEIGVFEMCGDGLQEVSNPSALFMGNVEHPAPGSAATVILEGTRPILVEVQTLVSSNAYPPLRRTVNGIDYHRLLMLLAVLDKRTSYPFQNKDVFVNIAGGLNVTEPAADLAVVAALFSGFHDKALGAVAFIGEVGLTGEVRGVSHLEQRVKEAAKFGFKSCIVPASGRNLSDCGCPVRAVANITELLAHVSLADD